MFGFERSQRSGYFQAFQVVYLCFVLLLEAKERRKEI